MTKTKHSPKWRMFLEAHGFKAQSATNSMWMHNSGFYIRRTRRGEQSLFAICSGVMAVDGAFHSTIEKAYATFTAWLLTKSAT